MASINEQCIAYEETSDHVDGGKKLFEKTQNRRIIFGGGKQGHQTNQIDLGPDIQGDLKSIMTNVIMDGRFDNLKQSGFKILDQKAIYAFSNKSNMEEKRKMICFVLWLQLQKGETIEKCICYILHPMVLYVGYANCKITKDHYELNGIRFAKKNQTHKNFQFNGNKVKRYDVNRLSHGRKFPYTIMEIPSTDELNAGCLIEQNFFPFFSNLGVTVFPDKLLRDEGVEK